MHSNIRFISILPLPLTSDVGPFRNNFQFLIRNFNFRRSLFRSNINMAKVDRNCFVCNTADEAEASADPKLISGGPSSRAKSLFILLQSALELSDLGADQIEIAHQISYCKSCVDELEVIQNVLDTLEHLKKLAERHKKEFQLKFLKVKGQESQSKSSKGLELVGVTKLRSQMVTGLRSRSRSTAVSDSSETSGVFKRMTRTRTKPNHFPGQTTPSAKPRTSPVPHLQISRSALVSPEIPAACPLDVSGKDEVPNSSNNGREANIHHNLHSDQGTSGANAKAGPSGIVKKTKATSDAHNSIQQISSSSEKKKPSGSSSTPRNKSQTLQRTHVKKHKCHVCLARFKWPSELTAHLRVHSKEKPFECEICQKTFSQKSKLKFHQVVHNGKKGLRCRFCSKAFARLGELKAHERVHTGERPFLCKLCAKTFSQSGTLVSHMRTHTREKPYKCTICFKEFTQLSNLKNHKRTHNVTE